MTLLKQIQTDALETHGDLAALLRRCRILAQRLELEELKQWVISELEGYADDESLPAYRKIETNIILGHFNGFGGAQLKNAQIAVSDLPDRLREPLSHVYFREAIAEVAQMLRDNKQGIRAPWPVEAVRLIGQGDMYEGFFLIQAQRVVNSSALRGILDQVQNRILNFVLELDSRDPEAGEAMTKSDSVPAREVRNIFYKTIVRGSVQNLAQGNDTVTQTAVTAQDFESLSHALTELGISTAEIKKAQAAISEDAAVGNPKPGAKIKAWLGELALKTGKAAVDSTTAAAVAAVIKQYFGT
jgi:hypothetical protein